MTITTDRERVQLICAKDLSPEPIYWLWRD